MSDKPIDFNDDIWKQSLYLRIPPGTKGSIKVNPFARKMAIEWARDYRNELEWEIANAEAKNNRLTDDSKGA
jgi:hypothetical protein